MTLSKSAVDRLGERLRDGTASEADWELLEELRAMRQRHLDRVVVRLRGELGTEVTGRVKTTNTLVEKLQRGRIRLSRMDDVAGARIVISRGRAEQDVVVASLLTLWPDARVKDRRTEPMHGYRAVHVILVVDGWPLEVQVRTPLQDAMAHELEALADRWGRQIRYGGEPEDAGHIEPNGLTRRRHVEALQRLADLYAEIEEQEALNEELIRRFDREVFERVQARAPGLFDELLELHQRLWPGGR